MVGKIRAADLGEQVSATLALARRYITTVCNMTASEKTRTAKAAVRATSSSYPVSSHAMPAPPHRELRYNGMGASRFL